MPKKRTVHPQTINFHLQELFILQRKTILKKIVFCSSNLIQRKNLVWPSHDFFFSCCTEFFFIINPIFIFKLYFACFSIELSCLFLYLLSVVFQISSWIFLEFSCIYLISVNKWITVSKITPWEMKVIFKTINLKFKHICVWEGLLSHLNHLS